ncbi:MAG: hypothetical protein HP491_01190 [Nitrospira sp.]|jgi:hypothetical protein|nr:hypothetical protein [Nitrospira sp.]MBH0183846.1 hypothetical protein [Nitrospira sp.]
MIRTVSLLLGSLLLLTTVACQSTRMTFPSAPPGPDEKVLGPTMATSTGLMLFGVIPINQNTRFENAMRDAAQKAGGHRLTDVTISERWFWAYVLDGFIFKVEGTAVGKK